MALNKTKIYTLIVTILLLLFTGCGLLDEDSDDDGTPDDLSPLTGTWIEAGDKPMEIVTFAPPKVYLYQYKSEMKKVDTTIFDLSIISTSDGFTVPNDEGTLDTLKFTVTTDSLTLVEGDKTYKFAKYSGDIPHPDWEIPTLSFAAGSISNNLPAGAWKSTVTGDNEIVVLTSTTLTIYEYDEHDMEKILWINEMPYKFNSTNDGFIVGEGTDTMTVKFQLTGTTLTVMAPDDDGTIETLTFEIYPSTTLPTEWAYDMILYEDDEPYHEGLDGEWLDTNRVLSFSFWEDSLHLYLYNPVESTLVDETFTYSLMEGSVNIYKSGMLVKNVQFYFSNDTLHIPDYDGMAFALTYTMEDLPLAEWVIKDDGTTGDNKYMGYWVLAGDTPDEIMMIKDYDINSVFYMSDTKEMIPLFMNYHLNEAMDYIYVKIPSNTGTEETWESPIYLSEDTLVITATPKGERKYVPYMGDIPHDTWDVAPGFEIWGNWWVENSTKDSIWNFYGNSLTIYAYNSIDSSYSETWLTYEMSAALDTLYTFDDQAIKTAWYMQMMTDGSISLSTSSETVKLIRSSDNFPPEEWILKDDGGYEDREYPPFIGEWLSSDGNQIVTFGPEVMTAFDFNNGILTIKSVGYHPNMTGDTLFTKDLAGNPGWVIPSEDASGLKLEFMGGATQTYTPHMGVVPDANWTITGGDDYSFTQQPFIGTWRAADVTRDAVVKVGATIITIVELRDMVIDTNYMDYKVNATNDTIMVYEMGNIGKIPISYVPGVSITVIPDEEGPQTFNYYDGVIPPETW